MTDILLIILAVMLGMNTAMMTAVYWRLVRKSAADRNDEKVQAAMDEAAEEEARRSRSMDEGFDNLMRFSVRGHDGFGGMAK